jgi:hypothetical protein
LDDILSIVKYILALFVNKVHDSGETFDIIAIKIGDIKQVHILGRENILESINIKHISMLLGTDTKRGHHITINIIIFGLDLIILLEEVQ